MPDSFLAIAYFDEAHSLHGGKDINGRNPYFALMHVMGVLREHRIFFVFLSTNSSLSTFAPIDAEFPSLRVRKGLKLIPPFFELPFDIFRHDFSVTLRNLNKLTLNGVCELEHMAKFGRPM